MVFLNKIAQGEVAEDCRVCLLDFGHSDFMEGDNRRPEVFGTPEYMAPGTFKMQMFTVILLFLEKCLQL